MGASPKKTITLSDKKEITIDVSTLTQREFRGFFDPRTTDEESDKILGRLCGEKSEYIANLLRDDYRRIMDAVVGLANRPLDDPNSQSVST